MGAGKHEMKTEILIVEDEVAIVTLLRYNLEKEGFQVISTGDGEEAVNLVKEHRPDIIVLDWMLPGDPGTTLLQRWRQDPRTKGLPVIMLTAKSQQVDIQKGKDAGADDYITKPFSTKELLARIRAVLRRRAPDAVDDVVQVGELMLDTATYRVSFRKQELKVGPTEFKLLHYLMKNAERVHSRGTLLDRVWGDHVYIEERTVDVHIKRLREALGEAGSMIETVRGAGYRLSVVGLRVAASTSADSSAA